jgi:hypothetical protein
MLEPETEKQLQTESPERASATLIRKIPTKCSTWDILYQKSCRSKPMFTSFVLENGREVKTPLLDGVLERAMRLMNNWLKKQPELASIPESILFYYALESADVIRILNAFRKAGIPRQDALIKAHGHLQEFLTFSSIAAFLGFNTWCLKPNPKRPRDPAAPPVFAGFKKDLPRKTSEPLERRLTEAELRELDEFRTSLPKLIGPEATEHLLQATLAYHKWALKTH